MTIRGVTIGDKFIDTIHTRSKRVSTVVDFAETRSMTTGKILDVEIIAQHEFMGQIINTYPAFTTVIRNRISKNEI